MGDRNDRPSLWLLPQPESDLPSLRRRRPALAYLIVLLALAGAVLTLVFVAPTSRWTPEALFVALLCAGFVSVAASFDLRGTIQIDSGSGVALVAVVLLGPAAGAFVYAAGEMITVFLATSSRRLTPMLENLPLAAWSCLAAAFTFLAFGLDIPIDEPSLRLVPAFFAAALAMLVLNFVLLGGSVVLFDGASFKTLRRDMFAALPVDMVMATLGLASVSLYLWIGLAGLLPVALMLLVPRFFAATILKPRALASRSQGDALLVFAELMAETLGLSRQRRTVIADAATQIGGAPQLRRVDRFQDVMQAVLYAAERWDGGEGSFPGVLSGENVPIESRILAVAKAWAALTARGTNELSARDALVDLKARAGTELDPTVVAAAVKVVEDDLLREPSSQTELHTG